MTKNNRNHNQSALAILLDDHKKARELFQEYKAGSTAENKQTIADEIYNELQIHSRLEEDIFYPTMRVSPGEEEKLLIDTSLDDHQKILAKIEELEEMAVANDMDAYDHKIQKLQTIVEHHVEVEENELFPEAEDKLGEELIRMDQEMIKLRQELES